MLCSQEGVWSWKFIQDNKDFGLSALTSSKINEMRGENAYKIHCVVIKSTQTSNKCAKKLVIIRFDSCSVPLARLHTRARFSPRSPAAARCSGSGWAATRSPDCQALSQRRSSSYPVALLHTHLTSSGCRPFLVKGCKTSSEFKKC